MSDISNNPRFKQLLPEDVEFYETVNSRIAGSHALPFEIPVDSFFTITVRCLKWFWDWYGNATQEQMLFIPYEEICKVGKDASGNVDLKLPNGIEAVMDWKPAQSSYSVRLNDYLRIALLQTYTSSGGATGSSFGNQYRAAYGSQNPTVSNAVISMYEAAQYRETFTRGIRANFNKNTQIFRLMTNVDTGLVLQCATRLHPRELYGDYLFEDYVVACVEEQLGRIVTSFDFKLPGSVGINYDQIKSYGEESKTKIEEDIKNSNNTDFIQSK